MTSTLERVHACIEDQDFVSTRQREVILDSAGNFFLLARPGSGKTRTVGIRLALAGCRPRSGAVAATSYTNIAIEQIRDTVRDLGVVLADRHFTGTLHEFFIRYVLAPFATRLGIRQPFQLVADNWRGWPEVVFRGNQRLRLRVSYFHYRADGTLYVRAGATRTLGLTPEEAVSEGAAQAEELKRRARARGLMSPSDALFYVLELLKTEPMLRNAVASRFHELIVDEAQDTSDVQLRCIDLLHETGRLASLVLVGDLDQSIYSFQGAAPALCKDLIARRELRPVPMTENFRSSQAICNVTCRFCGRDEPDTAVGPYRTCGIAPEVLIYPTTNPNAAVECFRARLAEHGLPVERAVVLTRAWALANEINGRVAIEVGGAVEAAGRLAASVQRAVTIERAEVHVAEQLFAELAWGSPTLPDDEHRRWELRRVVARFAASLPTLDSNLDRWTAGAREVAKNALAQLVDEPTHKAGDRFRSRPGFGSVRAADVFMPRTSDLVARTVHAVKGESHDAVLLVAERRKGQQQIQSELWSPRLLADGTDEAKAEELRIAYVALTRAERYCAVALPANTKPELVSEYTDAGFAAVVAE